MDCEVREGLRGRASTQHSKHPEMRLRRRSRCGGRRKACCWGLDQGGRLSNPNPLSNHSIQPWPVPAPEPTPISQSSTAASAGNKNTALHRRGFGRQSGALSGRERRGLAPKARVGYAATHRRPTTRRQPPSHDASTLLEDARARPYLIRSRFDQAHHSWFTLPRTGDPWHPARRPMEATRRLRPSQGAC